MSVCGVSLFFLIYFRVVDCECEFDPGLCNSERESCAFTRVLSFFFIHTFTQSVGSVLSIVRVGVE